MDENLTDIGNFDTSSLSSEDNDYIAVEANVPSSKDQQMDAEDYEYDVLTTTEIVQHQKQIIDEVSVVVQLSPHVTRILLNHFNWDQEKLIVNYFDGNDEEFFKKANVVNPANKSSNFNRDSAHENEYENCEICLSMMPSSDMTGLACDHRFCSSCWREYLTSKILSEGLGHTVMCAAHGCNVLVDDVFVNKLVTDQRVKDKYQQLIINSFVECNQLLRWCPSTDCTYVIKVTHAELQPVRCKCGHVFCFKCGQDRHDPVMCRWFKKWMKKCYDDGMTSHWIASNTKECPKCGVKIEKSGGCNSMICTNRSCFHGFCWLCLAPRAPHGDPLHRCNRYQADADAVREKNKFLLERYFHYYDRYKIHLQSLEFESKLFGNIKQKMEEQNVSSIEMQFLKEAIDTLCKCRQTLMNTYVFAYYVEKSNQSLIFEDNQKDFEYATEKLSAYLEREITAANLINIKKEVQDQFHYCEERRKKLLDHVNEGYEKNWWDFTEYLDN